MIEIEKVACKIHPPYVAAHFQSNIFCRWCKAPFAVKGTVAQVTPQRRQKANFAARNQSSVRKNSIFILINPLIQPQRHRCPIRARLTASLAQLPNPYLFNLFKIIFVHAAIF